MRGFRTLLSVLVLTAALPASAAAAEAPELYTLAESLETADIGLGVASATSASVSPGRLLAEPAALRLALPDGTDVTVRRLRSGRRPGGAFWSGITAEGGTATFTLHHGLVAGRFESAGRIWEMRMLPGGGHALLEIDSGAMPECAGGVDAREPEAAPQLPDPLGGGTVTIDVLVMYTPQARDGAGGVAAIEATAQAAVDVTNSAFIASAMDARFVLVGTELANYNDSGSSSADLSWLANSAQVAGIRDALGADMVGMLAEDGGGFCGIGYVMRNPGPGFASSAFQVTARGCAVGNLTYAHEHGHNMGFEHDPANGPSPGTASYVWSFGHFAVGQWRTVMSYSNQCSPCGRVGRFSNPDVNYQGSPTGIDNQRDNSRTGDLTAPIIEDFRPTANPTAIFADGFESGSVSAWNEALP